MNTKFIIVDDDALSNKICDYNIRKAIIGAEINCFQYPREGLEYILSFYGDGKKLPTVLFLDINMPEIDGWSFLEEFAKMDKHIQQQFTIYMVSTSIDINDKEKANNNPFIKDFMEKPLSSAALIAIVSELY